MAAKTSIKKSPKAGRGKRPTIVDIAEAAGISKSTVSLVLQDSPLVKGPTRERVRQAMDKLGYVYNRSAAGLRSAKSDFVGVVIGDLTNPFFPELAAGIQDVLQGLSMLPVLANANEDPEQQAVAIRSLREHGVAGIILSPARDTTAELIARSIPKGLPVVLTMRAVAGCPFPYVGPDNVAGMKRATKHLIDLGHRSIAFVGGHGSFMAQRERVRGWTDALDEAGLIADQQAIFDVPPTRDGGALAATRLLQARPKFTAAVCYNDIVALGLMPAIAAAGLKIGVEFSVVGFDDIAEAAHSHPPLTTINAGTRRMGAEAAQRLVKLLEKHNSKVADYLGEAQLIQRNSSGPLKE